MVPSVKDPSAALRRAMKAGGITLAQLAASVGVTSSAAWRWLRLDTAKRTRPDPITRIAIERLYGIPVDSWLTPTERAALAHAESLKPTG